MLLRQPGPGIQTTKRLKSGKYMTPLKFEREEANLSPDIAIEWLREVGLLT